MENEQLKQKAKEYAEENYQQFWDVENINELYKAFLAGASFVSQPSIEKCNETIEQICKGMENSPELIKHKANWLYILQRLSFWKDMPVLLELIKYEQSLAVSQNRDEEITGETSDGYHTFNELYEFRKVYNAALFNEWAMSGKYNVHKSYKHQTGELCFGGGWFIVVAILPSGQITNHYKNEDWDLFDIPVTDTALFEYDGHSGSDTIDRIKSFIESKGGKK